MPGRIQANGANRAVIGYPPGATRRSRVMVSFPLRDTAAFNRRNPDKLAFETTLPDGPRGADPRLVPFGDHDVAMTDSPWCPP